MSDSLQHLREHGFVILPGILSGSTVETLRSELQPHLGPFGRNPRKLVEVAARRQARDTDAPER